MSLDQSRAARAYAWALLAGHALALAFLLDTNALSSLLTDVEPLCWPYFESCGQLRFESTTAVFVIAIAYLLLILVCAAFISRTGNGYRICLLALTFFLFGVISLDYRMRANEFYMLLWQNGVYLFSRHRRWTIPLMLVSFYFWAGRLKLNYEWFSGSVLYHDLWWIPRRFTSAACIYVVVLEMVMIWGLLSRRRFVRWLVLAQLGLFHIESMSQIHWFYPALMATMLAWFLIEDRLGESERPKFGLLLRGGAPKAAYGVMAAFAAFQLMPLLYRGDSTLNGQGRIFALHMFEARQVCEVSATLHYASGNITTIDLKLESLPPRTICDPVVYYSRIQNICRARATDTYLADADLIMKVKRTTQKVFQTIVDEPHFCSTPHEYSVLFNNSWMK